MRGKGRDQLAAQTRKGGSNPQVSVPLRGKGRDQPGQYKTGDAAPTNSFPSPCGEKVGINMGGDFDGDRVSVHLFPSPCGEKVGINSFAELAPGECGCVSVPLRGKGRDQLDTESSVEWWIPAFPSPCGEKVGINRRLVRQQNSHNNGEVSVPLRGKGRDQRRWHLAHRGQVRLAVSVPLRGKGRDQR